MKKCKKKKHFEITENVGDCKRKTIEIRNVSERVQVFFVLVGIYTKKSPQGAPCMLQ